MRLRHFLVRLTSPAGMHAVSETSNRPLLYDQSHQHGLTYTPKPCHSYHRGATHIMRGWILPAPYHQVPKTFSPPCSQSPASLH